MTLDIYLWDFFSNLANKIRAMTCKRLFNWGVGVAFAAGFAACGNTSTTKTEKVEGVEWDVTVNEVVELNDSVLGIDSNRCYNVADTARVNSVLKDLKHCGNVAIGWTIPSADGSIWLVAYEKEPVLAEKVTVIEANSMPSYEGNIQVAFKFSDAKKWEEITRAHIGQRLAIVVDGQLMNAPQVNMEITSGACSVSIPEDMIPKFLPNLTITAQ